jgi:two-component system, OmpR family, sensor kinase
MSLRLRLLALLAGLAIVALLVVEAVTYVQLRAFLYDQIDRTVATSAEIVGDSLGANAAIGKGHLEALVSTTPGVYVGELQGDRTIRWQPLGVPKGGSPAAPPALTHLGPVTDRDARHPVTVSAASGELQYRVAVEPVGTAHAVLFAAPLDGVNDTLNRLLAIELAVSAVAIAGVLVAGAWLIGVSLRPLSRIERTASAIAGGDMTRRVPDATRTTEVGRLALAFNAMITRIDAAFAEQAESERVLRQFVADASHELRTPLTAVRAYAELFERGAKYHPDDLERAMSGIERETARMTVLVDDLLLLARLDQHPTMTARDVDLVGIARLAADASLMIDATHHVAVDGSDAAIVRGDPDALRRVVDNLLGNVRAYTPPGTSARVTVADGPEVVVLTVEDDGPGIPADLLEHVFERFSRADASRSRNAGGSGLGLAIVAAIADAHGGTVGAANADGHRGGARFTITLPAVHRSRLIPE